ncbi:MAG: tRNA (N6-isopentenyl adenosine(37)-C2)-methylthiotransferase MiaB [Chloroflexia bacterium]|nr:tRNA (N6-isopentenyl adenosine(37)-C2)-methylthiotransferase MiaB [Chloroflexia bacterium]
MRYHIWTSGCQMNQADSSRLAAALHLAGHQRAPLEQADLIILNTCVVREKAEQRAVGKLNALIGLKKRRPQVRIALMGCLVGTEPADDLAERFPMVDYFFPPSALDCVLQAFPGSRPVDTSGLSHLNGSGRPVTAFLPIIYGCDNFCAYCIVPLRRGRERSRPIQEIVTEAQCMVSQGVREICLLGQNVDSYGHDLQDRPSLSDLLQAVHKVQGLWRIRFLTSHPKDLTPELVHTVANLPKVCPEISLPAQAGHDRLLQRMGRPYTIDKYIRLVEHIRSSIPEVALSTDVIVGFPGESEEEYQGTRRLLETLRFDVVHVAAYSPRPGTAAAKRPDDVPAQVKKARQRELEALQEAISTEINAGYEGHQVEVLVENHHKGKWRGRLPQGKWCFFEDDAHWKGQLAQVRISKTSPWSLQGELVKQSNMPHPRRSRGGRHEERKCGGGPPGPPGRIGRYLRNSRTWPRGRHE